LKLEALKTRRSPQPASLVTVTVTAFVFVLGNFVQTFHKELRLDSGNRTGHVDETANILPVTTAGSGCKEKYVMMTESNRSPPHGGGTGPSV